MPHVKSKKNLLKRALPDVFLVFGFSCITYGLYLLFPPAAMIVAGAMLIFAGVPKSKKTVVYQQPVRKS